MSLISLATQSEFEETILEDLALLEIQGDQVTHTSDYFDHLYDLAVKLIESGKAYADDTEQLQVCLGVAQWFLADYHEDAS
jgi:glutamyl/glutaminyl-tRNA synthetase